MSAAANPDADDPRVFELVRAAVTLTKSEQIGKVQKLRARLAELYPGMEDLIEQALAHWANYERTLGSTCRHLR